MGKKRRRQQQHESSSLSLCCHASFATIEQQQQRLHNRSCPRVLSLSLFWIAVLSWSVQKASGFAPTTTTTTLLLSPPVFSSSFPNNKNPPSSLELTGNVEASFSQQQQQQQQLPSRAASNDNNNHHDDDEQQQQQQQHSAKEEEDWSDYKSTQAFNMDLHSLAFSDPAKAQSALETMEVLHQRNNTRYIKPDAACYTTVIEGWVMVGRANNQNHNNNHHKNNNNEGVEMAQRLLDRMEKLHDETNDESMRPNVFTYLLVCQGWAEHHTDPTTGAAQQAELVLRRMQQRGVQPDAKIYTSVLTGWCRRSSRVPHAMQRAQLLLSEMEKDDNKDNHRHDSIRPNVVTYTTFIGGWAHVRGLGSALHAQETLRRMKAHGVEPDIVAYTSVLNAWSRAKSRREREQAAVHARTLLNKIENDHVREQNRVKPTIAFYTACILAIGNSLEPDAVQQAQQVVEHMYQLHRDGNITGIKPSTATYNALITTLGRTQRGRGTRNARRAESLLHEMMERTLRGEKNVEPNERTWGGVMQAWAVAETPRPAQQAQRVLDKMEELYMSGESKTSPNVVCYTIVIRSWSKTRQADALDRAEQLLIRLEDKCRESKDTAAVVQPNAISYISMIDAFVRRDPANAVTRAQNLVDRIVRNYADGFGVRPSRKIFNALITALARSNDPAAAPKAEQILQWMEAQYRSGNDYVKPNEITFCAVLNAWANNAQNGGAERAQQILDHMESMSIDDRGFQQTTISYNIVIKAWARSQKPAAIRNAVKLLQRMEANQDVQLDATSYSSAINCCAYYNGPAKGRKDAFQIAMRIFDKLCQSDKDEPNCVTYGTLFKAISRLSDVTDQRTRLVQDLFGKCIRGGQVDGFVLAQMRHALPPHEFHRVAIAPHGIRTTTEDTKIVTILQSMPPAWGRNVMVY